VTVQDAPTARAAVQVPPAVPVGREKGCGVPPPKVKAPPARAEFPVFVTVRVSGLLVVPVAQLPKASEFGVTVAVCVATTLFPVRETGEPVTVTLPVIASDPVAPVVAVAPGV
jgi:hypothetical protein